MAYRKAEILSPAGTYDCLVAAIDAGADAVYAGGTRFGARAYAGNLDTDTMLAAIDYVHLHGRKLYMTVNTLLKSQEMEALYAYLLPYYERGLDGVIVQDMGVLSFLRAQFPDLPVHISTQCGVTSAEGARLFERSGASRIIPARELSLEEIRDIRDGCGLEIECFVHGALCYCYSGDCLLSSMIGGRSGNRGQCAGPCRLPYQVGNESDATLLSMKDLCTIKRIPELIDAGVDAFKIEGRMKQPDYVFTVTRMYRTYMDLYARCGPAGYKVSESDEKELKNAYTRRGYTDGYLSRHNGREMISFARIKPAPEEEENIAYVQDPSKKLPITGELSLFAEEPARLRFQYQDIQVCVEGERVERAKNQPLTEDGIRRQMEKTGDTPFLLSELQIQMDENIFLTVKALNALRRDAIGQLLEACVKDFKRPEPSGSVPSLHPRDQKAAGAKPSLRMAAFVSTQKQLLAVMKAPAVKRIYVEPSLGLSDAAEKTLQKKPEGKEVFLATPFIFRQAAVRDFTNHYEAILSRFDGLLIRSMDAYAWAKERQYPHPIAADDTVYVFQENAREYFYAQGLTELAAPAELNERELKELGITSMTLVVYGYHPVMVSAGCIKKNTASCDHREGMLYMRDRKGMKFPVKNFCRYCYNVIYNCMPLNLLDQKEEIFRLSPRYLRLDFTIESGDETAQILSDAASVFFDEKKYVPPEGGFTRGHFKRGVK